MATKNEKSKKSTGKPMTLFEKWEADSDEPGGGIKFTDEKDEKAPKQPKSKSKDSRREALLKMADELKSTQSEIMKYKSAPQQVKKTVIDVLPANEETGGMPSEVESYKGMSYEEVIRKALESEKEAIFLGLYAIELAPDKDIKKLIEITNDENDHSKIYQQILDRLGG